MDSRTNFRKYAIIPIVICLAALLASAVFFGLGMRSNAQLGEISESSGEFVCRNMTAVGAALDAYSDTGDETYLRDAADAACKAAAVCRACGDTEIYLTDGDLADDAIRNWGIVFLIRTYNYLDGLLETGIGPSDPETLSLLTDAYRPDGEAVTFTSLFTNASISALKDDFEWTGLNYTDGQLQWPEF